MSDEMESAPRPGGDRGALRLDIPGWNGSQPTPPYQKPQTKFPDPDPTEFDAEIALALTASGWRVTAALLTLAAKCIEAGDFQSAERNRRQARDQFNAATDVFRQFQEARAAEGASLLAEAFK